MRQAWWLIIYRPSGISGYSQCPFPSFVFFILYEFSVYFWTNIEIPRWCLILSKEQMVSRKNDTYRWFMYNLKPCSNDFSVLLQLRLYIPVTPPTTYPRTAEYLCTELRRCNRNTRRIKIKYWYYRITYDKNDENYMDNK